MLIAFFTALAATVAAQAAPGPNLLAVASVALSQGRLPAVLVAAGVATGVWFWVAVCALGVSVVFEAYPVSNAILRVAGGLYFIYLAIRTAVALRRGNDSLFAIKRNAMTPGAAYMRRLLVVLTNPKAAIMWIAITAFLFGSGLAVSEVLWMAPAGSLSALVIYGCYGYLFSTSVAKSVYQRLATAFELTFAALFGFLGLRLVYDGMQPLVTSLSSAARDG